MWSCNLCMQNIDTFLIVLLMCAEFKILNSTSPRNKLGSAPQALTETVQETSKSHCQHHTDPHKAKTNSPQSPAHICTPLHRKTGTEKQCIHGSKKRIVLGRSNLPDLSIFPENLFLFLLLKRNDWIKANSFLSQKCGPLR